MNHQEALRKYKHFAIVHEFFQECIKYALFLDMSVAWKRVMSLKHAERIPISRRIEIFDMTNPGATVYVSIASAPMVS